MEAIRGDRILKLNAFFKKADPDSIYPNQQLYSVTIEKEITDPITKQKKVKKVTTSNKDAVLNEAEKKWGNVLTSKVKKHFKWLQSFHTNIFKSKKLKIKNKDQELYKEITIEEYQQVISKLSNKKQPGPDRIPNELFKILKEHETFTEIYIKILNSCIETNEIPLSWKESNIYIIYKKLDPTDPLNYRPIVRSENDDV